MYEHIQTNQLKNTIKFRHKLYNDVNLTNFTTN